MVGSNYKPEERSGNLEEKDYLATVIGVEDKTSRSSGREMRVIEMRIAEEDRFTFKAYLVDDEYFNAKATEFFDAFHVQRGVFDKNAWMNRQGYIHIRKSKPKEDGKQYWEFAWFVKNPNQSHTAQSAPATTQAKQPEKSYVAQAMGAAAPNDGEFPDDIPF